MQEDKMLCPTVIDWDALPGKIFGATPELVRANMRLGYAYVATPYTKRVQVPKGKFNLAMNEQVRIEADKALANLFLARVPAVSPISMAAGMVSVESGIDPFDQMAWERWCMPLLMEAAAIVVPNVPGWHESEGVWREACFAVRMKRPLFVYAASSRIGGRA